jgi:hypothetical protein
MWAALNLWEEPTLFHAGVLGACCGLAALARAELLLFVLLLGVVVAVRACREWADRGRLAFVVIAASLVVIAPWVLFNLARFEERTFLSTNDGVALAGSNCDAVYRGADIGLTNFVPCLAPLAGGDQSCSDPAT